MNIDDLRELCHDESIEMTRHVLDRCLQRNIKYADVKNCILNGEIIENYPDDYPYPSCLVLSIMTQQPLHIVVGLGENKLWIITAYYPNPKKWAEDYKTRRENS